MDTQTKNCPSCKQLIQADAMFCPYCGVRFSNIFQGYCSKCHAIRDLDSMDRCIVCGGEVLDRQPKPLIAPSNAGQPQPDLGTSLRASQRPIEPLKPAQPKKKAGCLSVVRGVLVVFGLVLLALWTAYTFSDRFQDWVRSLGNVDTSDMSASEATRLAANALEEAETPEITRTPAPTRTPHVKIPALPLANAVCAGGFGYGLSCLSDNGSLSIPTEELPYTGRLSDMAACPDEVFLLVSDVFYGFAEGKWTQYGQYGGTSSGMIGCGEERDVWIIDNKAAYQLDDPGWTIFDFETVLNGVGYISPKEVVVTPDHHVWVASSETVVYYDGSKWSVFDYQQDVQAKYILTDLAVDSKGTLWVTSLDGVATFDGNAWKKVASPTSTDVLSIFIDPADQIWVGSEEGVHLYKNGGWQSFRFENKTAGRVTQLEMDGLQRVWVGTDWGLGVLEDGKYTFYHMADSDLIMNEIDSVMVLGNGPTVLREKIVKETGSMQGTLMNGDIPLSNARVEVCVQTIYGLYSGTTPCSDQPFMAGTKSDADGNFSIPDLPTGYYIVTIQGPDGKWKVRSNTMSVGSVFFWVRPGEVNIMGAIDIAD
ncbi:MAG: hypothetical protein JW987_00470 [Anaerolineaceae bacterium]|nr:hypothetical protein [Anaerolineaceae bacterium]